MDGQVIKKISKNYDTVSVQFQNSDSTTGHTTTVVFTN